MQDIIVSYLTQKRECNLPLLGNFKITKRPPVLDVAGKQLTAPTNEIDLTEADDEIPQHLINYISGIQNISPTHAEEKLNDWCIQTKMKIHEGNEILFEPFGILHKDVSGNIVVQKNNHITFYEPVAAERVIHKDAEHAVLVGDRETTSTIMNEFYKEETDERRPLWKIAAIILAAIAVVILIFYFATHKFSTNGIASQPAFQITEPSSTYSTPK